MWHQPHRSSGILSARQVLPHASVKAFSRAEVSLLREPVETSAARIRPVVRRIPQHMTANVCGFLESPNARYTAHGTHGPTFEACSDVILGDHPKTGQW